MNRPLGRGGRPAIRGVQTGSVFWRFVLSWVFSLGLGLIHPAAGVQAAPFQPTVVFDHYSIQRGLSQCTVTGIVQDRLGFLWFGTQDGLNRFNGYDFTVFRTDQLAPATLSDNGVQAVQLDATGALWIGTNQGLTRHDPASGRWLRFLDQPGEGAQAPCLVQAICDDGQNGFWLGTPNGVRRFSPTSGVAECPVTTQESTPPQQHVYALVRDARGVVWAGGDEGLFSRTDGVWRKTPLPLPAGSRPDAAAVRALCLDRRGRLWVGTRLGLYQWTSPSPWLVFRHQESAANSLSDDTVRCILEDRSGTVWVGTRHGLNQYRGDGLGWTTYYKNPSSPGALRDDNVRSLFQDQDGNLWIGTWGAGVHVLDPHRSQWGLVRPSALGFLAGGDQVRSFAEDEAGCLFFGTVEGGLYRFDPVSGQWANLAGAPSPRGKRWNNSIRGIGVDPGGGLWVATFGEGLWRQEAVAKSWSRIPLDPNGSRGIPSNFITQVRRDRQGRLWVGTDGAGLGVWDAAQAKWFSVGRADTRHPALPARSVTALLEDRQGFLWVGSPRGLYRLDPKTLNGGEASNDPETTAYLDGESILCLSEALNGDIWVGSTNGVIRLSTGTAKWVNYSVREGLPNNCIYGVLEDRRGGLWLGTNRGLSRYDPASKACRTWLEQDGLQSNEFNAGSFFASRSGLFLFGGVMGFNLFDPAGIQDEPSSAPVRFLSFRVFDTPLKLDRPPWSTSELTLKQEDNFLTIEFAALEYRNPERIRYEWRMDDIHRDWIAIGSRRFVSLANLPGGEYTLQVRARDDSGTIGRQSANLRIHIIPPYFQRTSFRILLALVALLLAGTLFSLQVRSMRLKMERKRLEHELFLKADMTAMLVHDLRNPLQSITGYAELLMLRPSQENCSRAARVILNASGSMLRLINDMLDISKFEAGRMALSLSPVKLADVVSEVLDLMLPLARKAQVEVCLIKEDLPPIHGDATRLGQVVGNLVSNAVKFSGPGQEVTIRLHSVAMNEGLGQEVSVADTGPGIDPRRRELLFDKYAQLHAEDEEFRKGTGLGLAVSRLIIEAHGGVIGYRPQEGGGSLFYFQLRPPAAW